MPTIWRPTTGGPADKPLDPVSGRQCDQKRRDALKIGARSTQKQKRIA
jgi:hypothetical protein